MGFKRGTPRPSSRRAALCSTACKPSTPLPSAWQLCRSTSSRILPFCAPTRVLSCTSCIVLDLNLRSIWFIGGVICLYWNSRDWDHLVCPTADIDNGGARCRIVAEHDGDKFDP